MKSQLSYSSSGINYDKIDFIKRLAQSYSSKTIHNLSTNNFREVMSTKGESAYVIDVGNQYLAFVQEGLGTKNIVADKIFELTGKDYYEAIAEDTVAAIVNDLITVGAEPLVVMAYWATGGDTWFNNKKRAVSLVKGWQKACNKAGATWGGGETPVLKGIINKRTIDLAGSAFGIINPKQRLVTETKLKLGDKIILLESSGIHTNGLSLARKIADKLSGGYLTRISEHITYGQAILKPTIIYSKLINDLLINNIDIHYMVNITGHGWRKIMRSRSDFIYQIENIPPQPKIFKFMLKKKFIDTREAYSTFNMGAGYAIFVPEEEIFKIMKICKKHRIKAYVAGTVKKGRKKLIIKPEGIVFDGRELDIRN